MDNFLWILRLLKVCRVDCLRSAQEGVRGQGGGGVVDAMCKCMVQERRDLQDETLRKRSLPDDLGIDTVSSALGLSAERPRSGKCCRSIDKMRHVWIVAGELPSLERDVETGHIDPLPRARGACRLRAADNDAAD